MVAHRLGILILFCVSSVSFGARVVAAKLDGEAKNILVDVVHGGGCGTHTYSLQLKGCGETSPVQCVAELVHSSNDPCEALLHRTAVFSLEKYGLNEEYFSGGVLTILGSPMPDGKTSKASVKLPF